MVMMMKVMKISFFSVLLLIFTLSIMPNGALSDVGTPQQIDNHWKSGLWIEGWTYGDEPNKPVCEPLCGTPVYTYSNSTSGTFTSTVPTSVGTWFVKAFIAETAEYTSLEAIQYFMINYAQNNWLSPLSITGWSLGEDPNAPTCTAMFGTPVYSYCDTIDGAFTSAVPATVGTWFVKAVITETTDYSSLESTAQFTITPAIDTQKVNRWTAPLSMVGWAYGEEPNMPTATALYGTPKITYCDTEYGTYTTTIPATAGTWFVKAAIAETPEYSGLEAIDSFTISQGENSWVMPLSIKGWTYKRTPKEPSATAKFGITIFTYSKKSDGEYSNKVPNTQGTWYVKADVAETTDYSGLASAPVKFVISSPKEGFIEEDGQWYHYIDNVRQKGWVAAELIPGDITTTQWRYFDPESGAMQTGWIKTSEGNDSSDGLWYYLDLETGVRQDGWLYIPAGNYVAEGLWYYLRPDWGGALLESGWIWDNNYTAWFYARGTWGGAMAINEWIFTDGYWYYLGSDGKMYNNTYTPDGLWVDENGKWAN